MGTVHRHGEFEMEEMREADEIEEHELRQWKKLEYLHHFICKSVPWDHTKHTDEENFIKMFSDMQYDSELKDTVFETYFTQMCKTPRKINLKLSK